MFESRPCRLAVAVAAVLTLIWPNLCAQTAPQRQRSEEIDRRRTDAAKSEPVAAAFLEQLRSRLGQVQVDRDPITGGPRFISSGGRFLTGPAGEGGAVSAAGLAGFPVDTDLRAVKAFLSEHRAVFGHGPEALDAARKIRDYVDPHNGMRTVVWEQTMDGIPVFEGFLKAHVTKRGELVNIGSGWVRDANAAAATGTPGRASLMRAPKVSAAESMAIASGTLGGTLRPEHVTALTPPEGASQRHTLTAPTLSDITAEYTWLPVDSNTLRLCWKTVFTVQLRGEMFLALVDAATGEVLLRRGLTEYISDATYQVFTSDSPSPFSPGHATPSAVQPPLVGRTAVTTPALNTTASLNGWIDDGVNETRGNNVDAHADANADNVPDLPRPQGSPSRVFAPALDLTQAPSISRDAAIVNLFYWCNRIHDRYYELGFTEAAGNFQNTNFGRGGAGNDAVQADAQDGSGTDNANFSTPADGSPGRMQMYIFTGPTPDRDGDFDAEIITHEYTHGLSNRLVGGGVGMSALVSRGMGEGWSDFYALSLLSEAADNPRGNYAKGGYATYQLSGMTQNYYYGIRRYPYSTDLTKNPLTFKDINPAQANPHTGIPRSTIVGSTADEVHNMGEVWCVTLWEARANLVEKLGFPAGNDLMLQLVTDGMKLAPANPNFLQARDAILQAELVLTAGANRGELWTAFSKRGMGANATAPVSSTTTGLVENFDIPDALGIAPTALTSVSGTAGGPFVPASATFTLVNSTTTPLNWTASDDASWLSLSDGSGTLGGSAVTTLTANILPAANSLAAGDYTAILTFTNTTSGLVQTRSVSLHIDPVTIPLFAETWEGGTAGPAWLITGTAAHRTQVTTANGPHGGTYHLTMDSSADGSLSRNEATWTVNLAGRTGVQLRFWVKMFSDEPNGPPTSPFTTGADFDGVAISANGTTWYEVQPLRTLVSSWTRYVVDLDAAIAARGLSYNSAFKIRFNHYDDFGIPTDGFAFDDIDLVQIVTNRLTIALPTSAPENGGLVSGTLSVVPTPASDLTVTLTSSDSSEATVPPTIIIPAGQSSVALAVNVLDDSELDGTQPVTITASASAYVSGSADLDVTDNETATLTLTLPASGTEGGPAVTGTISASAAVAANVKVTLQSSDVLNVQIPPTVMISAGQTSATFPVTIVDDPRIDGPQTVTITASVANWTASSASITALDNDPASLTVILPSGLREGGTPQNGTVRIGGTLPTPLIVSLASSDLSEATVPSTVTIVAGQTSAIFSVTPIDDVEADGSQPVTITATAAGFVEGSATASVADNDAHHFSISPIVGPILRGSTVSVSVSAKDVNDVTITSYNQTVGFGAADSGATNIPVTPSSSAGFVNGILTANLTFGAYGTGVVLAVADTGGHRGTSTAFDVIYGPVSRFQWSAIPPQQYVDAPFPVAIRAVDSAGNSVPTYTGSATIGAALNSSAQILSWITYADTSAAGEYVQTKQAISTFFADFTETTTTTTDAATLASQLAGKSVFLIPEQENSNSGTLGTLGTAWASVLNNFVNSGGTVIVCSNTASEHLLLTNSGLLNVTSIASPTSASVTKPADTPLNAGVSTPFTGSWLHTYATTNGTISLQTSAAEPVVISRDIGAGRVVLIGTDYFTLGTGMDRVIANAVKLGQPAAAGILPVAPQNTTAFVSGEWSDNITIPFTANGVRLRATNGALAGDSNLFDVGSATVPSTSTTIFSEDFESGSLNPAYWTVTGTGPYRTQVNTLYAPHGGARHMTMDSTGGLARNEATLTVNLAGRTGAVLKFWAAGYGDEPNGPPTSPFSVGADFDGVAISADGTTWWEVQAMRSLPSTYAQFTVNLDAAIAARGISYGSSFKIRFNQYDDNPLTTDGIVVDDILITANAPPTSLTFTVPPQVTEGAGTISGMVNFTPAPASDLVLNLSSKSPGKISIPATVTIPAGQTTASFSLNVLDDSFVDGTKTVVLTASGSGILETGTTIQVIDNDGGTLGISLPATVQENAGIANGTLTLSLPALLPVSVTLSSDNPAAAQVPTTITVQRGATTLDFPITIPDDTVIDGDQTARITATLAGWTPATGNLLVQDNESKTLTVSFPSILREGDAPQSATVSLSGTLATSVAVTLVSSDTSAVTVPAIVTIPAGQITASFSINIVDDTVADGAQPFTITASAVNFGSASASGTVRDNEAHHFTFAPIASPQVANGPIPAIVTAKDPLDAVLVDYNSPLLLSATSGSGTLPVTPTTANAFVNGVWNGSVQINAVAGNVVLTAADGQGHQGSSNPFDLVAGNLAQFGWDMVASPQTVDTPVNVTVRAQDPGGATVPAYNGVANLFVLASSENQTIGTGTGSSDVPMYTYYHDCRSDMLYTASELGGPARITGLSLNVLNVRTGGEALTNWTIRLKHTSLANLVSGAAWDNSGWTTVYRASPTVAATGWVSFKFTTPFDYNGTSNLLVDFSMDRTVSNSSFSTVQGSSTSQTMVIYGTSNSANGDPLTWSGVTPYPGSYYQRPDIRLATVKELPIRPQQTSAFSSGVWSGQISIPLAGSALMLQARAGTIGGTSNPFDVANAPSPPTGGATVFADDFESGTLNPTFWSITGTGNYRTQVTTYLPHGGTRHMAMDEGLGSGSYARNEATLTLNLAGRTGVVLKFWAAAFGEEPDGPPPSPFPSTGANFDGVAISADGGTNWYEVQPLRTLTAGYTQLTVDLDAALVSRGLTYSNNFKIRFNQYDNFSLGTDGIGIDDIVVTANPLAGITFTAPAQVNEGAGAVNVSVALDSATGTDTVVSLSSSAPAKITVPSSVTIPAGQTSAAFLITVLDDTIVDGNRTVAVSGSLLGQLPKAALITVIDNDILSLSLSAPATVAEGITGVTGSVTMSGVASGPITVGLRSSDTTAVQVPVNVILSAGQRTASFPITVIDDSKIDGTQLATITASVPGWVDATTVVQVTDNENGNLTISGPSSVTEGSTATGTIFISGTLQTNLVVTLASSTPTQLSVPASVTIPAGQTSVSFVATGVDDPNTDGTQAVTLTASAPGLSTGTSIVYVYDNDIHHFGISTIPSTQTTGVPFNVSLTAQDVNGTVISTFTGTASLSAAGDGGTVVVAPVATGNFSSGSWTGSVACNTARTNVRLAAGFGAVSSVSNAFNVVQAPAVSIMPASLSLTLNQGDSTTRTMTIGNTGGGTLNWVIATSGTLAEVVNESPAFSGIERPDQNKDHAEAHSPSLLPAQVYVQDREPAGLALESAGNLGLQAVLNNLNANSGLVRGTIPNRYAFLDGTTGINIVDGGGDMYDSGNYLGTNLGSFLSYSDNIIAPSGLLGSGGQYFTRKYDGLWVFAADVNAIINFDITGNLGADGGGSTDTAVLSVTRDGITYRGFVKRVYNAGDPSVNHLIIVADNGSVTHAAAIDTDDDYHRLTNLTGVTRIYYLLYAGLGGAYIDNTAALNIMTTFLDAISVPDWISPSAYSGSIAAGGSQNVTLAISAASLSQGTYIRTLVVNSNDPLQPQATLPVTLNVLGVANLAVSPATGLTSAGVRGGPFTPASQVFTITNVGAQPLTWTAARTATWLDLLPVGGTLAAGASATVTATVNGGAGSLTSGSYTDTILFTNTTNGVGTTSRPVALNIAAFGELTVTPALDLDASGPFGGPFIPASQTYILTNSGDAPLNWLAAKSATWLTLSSAGGTLLPGASATVLVTVDAPRLEPGPYTDTVLFTNDTNGRGNTTRSAQLSVVLPAPSLAAEPPITPATSNSVSWGAIPGANAYEAQCSSDAAFINPASSGWINGTSHTFNGLVDGTLYYYRVRVRRVAPEQSETWSQTTQAEFETGAKSSVATTAAGSVVLLSGSGAEVLGRIANPGFENSLTSWSASLSSLMGAQTQAFLGYSPMPTNGSYFTLLFSFHNQPHLLGDTARLTQNVDLTGLSKFTFDAKLTPPTGSTWVNAVRGEVRIDGQTVWSRTAEGNYLNQSVDVSTLTGVHEIELRNEVVVAGTYNSQWVVFDNLRAYDLAGTYVAAGTLISPPISPATRQRWGHISFTKDTGATATSLTIDVLDSNGSALATNVSSGSDLNTIPALAGQPSIALRANLSTTNSANTPRLEDWSVAYVTAVQQTFLSEWSNVESSTQFNAPPTIGAIPDQSIPEDGSTLALPISMNDDSTPVAELILGALSSNPVLVPPTGIQISGVGANRTIQVTPAANQNGSAIVTVSATDEAGKTSAQTFTVAVLAVNDAPQFLKGPDQEVMEDAGQQVVQAWATQIGSGAANESAQTVEFVLTNDNPSLFSSAPTVAPNGTLTYTLAPDANGTATVLVQAHDDGGTLNGGVDSSQPQSFTIAVAPVNDPPTLSALSDVDLLEDAPERTVALIGISSGAANESQTLIASALSSDPALIPAPIVSYSSPNSTGVLRFTPAPDAVGTATITVTVNDGAAQNATTSRSFLVRIGVVNDAPSFLNGPDQTVLEDSGAQLIPAWATQFTAGPANEVQQALDFIVTNNNAALFSTAPAISPTGTLTYTPAPDANGTATITVQLHDDGGNAAGGVDTSLPQAFTITVTPVNDPPTFTKGPNQSPRQNSGAQSIAAWAAAITRGAGNERDQALEFFVSSDNPALFASQPSLTTDGTLTFTPAPNVTGAANVTVTLHDDGGTANGGSDTSAPQTFVISTTVVNDAPSFVMGPNLETPQDAGPQSVPAWATQISAGPADEAGQLLQFSVLVDDPSLFTVAPSISPDGTLVYTPAPGGSGTATITVRLNDNGGTDDGGVDQSEARTFTIAVTTFAEETGTYNGLVHAPEGLQPSAERAGLIRVTIDRSGHFSGKLIVGGKAQTFKGGFDLAGVAHFGGTEAASWDFVRRGLAPLSVALKLDVAHGSDTLAGTLSESAAIFAQLEADRAVYSAQKAPIPPFRNVPADLVGAYTMVFAARTPLEQQMPAAEFPQGDGIARAKLKDDGMVRMVGVLADGTRISYANALSKAAVWPFYQGNTNGFAITGPVTFRDTPDVGDLDGISLAWFCAAAKRGIYPAGWPGGIRVDLVGSKYRAPRAGLPIFDGLPPADDDGNAVLTLTDGGLPEAGMVQALNIDEHARTRVIPASSRTSVRINSHTGLITGRFTHPLLGRATRFQGAVLQKQVRASGAFRTRTAVGGVTLSPQ